MKLFSRKQFDLAQNYIQTQARPLERKRFELDFEEGSVDAVLTQLGKFQNPDGGFGNALEPDMRTPTSSALCTEIGLRILAELDTPAEHPLVSSAVAYLLETFDPETQVWRVVPMDANEHPHAPWWHDEDGSLARTFDDFLVIPRAGVLALLHHYAEFVPATWLTEITQTTITAIQNMDVEKFGSGGDALVYMCRLAESPELPTEIKAWLVPLVQKLADQIVARDPAQWVQYCAPPLKLAPTPQAISAAFLGDCLPAHLDYLIETQSPAGYWDVNWSWGDSYSDVWPLARQEWRGDITLMNLQTLKAFGRIQAIVK